MSAKEIYIPEYITKVLRLLKDGGHEGFLVGGCVRDSLMGKEPHDYDITTSATPDEMKRCFAGEKVIETGVRHGTLTVVSDSNNVEVTTFRVDGEYEDNRHPTQVSFTHRLQDDLSRRDFTVNAMAYSPERGVVDIFDGQKDIERRLIRCVGDPDKRFNEDALRILRALRFSSALDFDIDKNTDESIRKNKGLLKNISSERIYSELVKIILGNGAERVLLSYPEVIAEILPELSDCMGFEQNNPYHCYDVYTHTVKAVCAAEKDKILRLALLFHDAGKPESYSEDERGGHFYAHAKLSAEIAQTALKRLKVDNRTLKSVTLLVLHHDRQIAESEKAVRRVLSELGEENFRMLIKIKRADNMAQQEFLRYRQNDLDILDNIADSIIEKDAALSVKSLKINGSDLLSLGFKEGKSIGETLDKLLNDVIDGNIANEKDILIQKAKVLKNNSCNIDI